jgi:peptidoglycan/xylan/chitin deacetylase (PgdA/CDA1 family)
LLYHRIGAPRFPGCEVIPTVPVSVFRAQLQAMGEIFDLVTLDEILRLDGCRPPTNEHGRAKVAITFDDDLKNHVTHALPVLSELGVPAAFFLSGRTQHGFGPYWFQQLEALLAANGGARMAALLDLHEAAQPRDLALACEQHASMRNRLSSMASLELQGDLLESEDVLALANAGMTIGFHTLGHSTLPGLNDAELSAAVTFGRDQLAAAASVPVRYFAYPHGKVDERAAAAVRAAGFAAAFTSQTGPLTRHSNYFRLGRWEPGPLSVDDLVVKLAMCLHSPSPSRAFGTDRRCTASLLFL